MSKRGGGGIFPFFLLVQVQLLPALDGLGGFLRRPVTGEAGPGLLPDDGPDVLVPAYQAVRRLVEGHDLIVVLLRGGLEHDALSADEQIDGPLQHGLAVRANNRIAGLVLQIAELHAFLSGLLKVGAVDGEIEAWSRLLPGGQQDLAQEAPGPLAVLAGGGHRHAAVRAEADAAAPLAGVAREGHPAAEQGAVQLDGLEVVEIYRQQQLRAAGYPGILVHILPGSLGR